MSPADLDLRQHAILSLARDAGRLAMRHFRRQESLGVTLKGAQDWLTVADGAVETYLRQGLASLFPSDAVIGEEGGGDFASRVWIIDPIDGTANFAHGDKHWCISIGFLRDGVPEIGVIHAPAHGELFLGRRGGGAFLDGEPIRAADTPDISRAAVEFGWSPRRPQEEYLAMVGRAFASGASVKRGASGALGLAHVADGRSDGYAELHINAWDVAAGVVIAREAGCRVSDFFAGNGVATGNPILCAAPGVASALEEITGIALR